MTGPDLGMPTTVGSYAFTTLKARGNAWLVDQVSIRVPESGRSHGNCFSTISDVFVARECRCHNPGQGKSNCEYRARLLP